MLKKKFWSDLWIYNRKSIIPIGITEFRSEIGLRGLIFFNFFLFFRCLFSNKTPFILIPIGWLKDKKKKNQIRSENRISDRKFRIPIGILDFRSEIQNSDWNSRIPIGIPDFRSEIQFSDFFFLTFNYEKVPIKNQILQSSS